MRLPEPSSRLKATPIRVAAPPNAASLRELHTDEARPSAGPFRVRRLVVTGSRRWRMAPLHPPPLYLCTAASDIPFGVAAHLGRFLPRLGPPLGAAPFLAIRSMFQLERLLMLPISLNPVAQLSFDTLGLGREALSLIGLRLFKMATGRGTGTA